MKASSANTFSLHFSGSFLNILLWRLVASGISSR
jgi:hypothetical protein